MPYRRTAIELLHTAATVTAVAAAFGGGAWVYPQGYATIWNIGVVTMAAVAGMGVPELLKAWAADRGARGEQVSRG